MIADFDHFRFIRDRQGSLAELPSERKEERIFLVLDCQRYRLGQLHIFEGLADSDSEQSELFDREMTAIRSMTHPGLTPILGHGRDDTELYYAEAIPAGESLGSYLQRVGPLPEMLATGLVLDLLAILMSHRDLPGCLENFDLGRCHISAKGPVSAGLRLHVSDYGGWRLPPASRPANVVERVALGLYSLLSGFVFRFAPHTLFNREALQTSDEVRNLIETVLKGDPEQPRFRSLESFAKALRAAHEIFTEDARAHSDLPPVRSFFRDWLMAGHDTIDPGAGYNVAGPAKPDEFSHAFDASTIRGGAQGRLRFQLFPGLESIPREGWLDQHHSALRRLGRGLPNQLAVVALETWGRCLLIGEERVEGVTIASLIRGHGALNPDHVREIVGKVNAALDVIEKTTGAAPVWRLGSRDVFLVTGDTPISALVEEADRNGSAVWRRLPVRLRLHQTAIDLIDGIDLPEAVMRQLRAGGKGGEHGRRATVLFPLICEMITGAPVSWRAPIVPRPGLPKEVAALLEKTRRLLVEDPQTIQSWLLDDLSHALEGGGKPAPQDSATMTGEALVSTPLAKPDDLETVEDGAITRNSETVTVDPAATQDSPLSLTLKPFSRHRATGVFPSHECDVQPAAGGQVTVGDTEDLSPAADSQPTPSAAAPVESPSTGVESLGLIVDAFVENSQPAALPLSAEPKALRRFRHLLLLFARSLTPSRPPVESEVPAVDEETAAAEVPDSISDTESDPGDSSPELNTDVEALHLLAPADSGISVPAEPEPISFFSFLKSRSGKHEPESGLPDSEEIGDLEAEAELAEEIPSVGSMLRVTSLREGFGLSDPAPPESVTTTDDETPAGSTTSHFLTSDRARLVARYGRVAGVSIAAAAALWGLTYGLATIAGSVERETLAETFEPVIQNDYFKLASQHPTGLPPLDDSELDPKEKSVTADLQQIPDASEAIRLGAEARSADRNSDAVNLYLRALELDPSSTEARTQLWATLETWSGSQNAPTANDMATDELGHADEHAPRAAWLLADYHLRRDRALGLLWLRRSAEAGHARHQRILGLILSGVPDSLPEAIDWLRRAAESGDTETQLLYGAALLRGRGVPVDLEKGADWIEKAAMAGNGQALDLLGVCHSEGLGRPVDPVRSLELFQKAVDAGNTLATYNLATRFAKGLGTPRDKLRAAQLYRAGAEHGDPHCMHALGRCLEAGFGVPRDLDNAVSWMRRAASLGHHDALAWCLREGIAMDVATL